MSLLLREGADPLLRNRCGPRPPPAVGVRTWLTRRGRSGLTAMQHAARKGSVPTLVALAEEGKVDINYQAHRGGGGGVSRPLHSAEPPRPHRTPTTAAQR